jgi:hypothetical protein
MFLNSSDKIFPYTQTKLGLGHITAPVAMLQQSIGIGFKKKPISIGLSGELLGGIGARAILLGLNFGFSF